MRRELSSTTAPTAATEAPTTPLTAAAASLALAMKRVGTDVADRSLQRIGLLGSRAAPRPGGLRRTATRAKTPTPTPEATPARRAARVLHKAFVEGLFERVGNRSVIEIVVWVEVGIGVTLKDRLAVLGSLRHLRLRWTRALRVAARLIALLITLAIPRATAPIIALQIGRASCRERV